MIAGRALLPIPAARFGAELLVHDLPALPDERRAETVAFIERRLPQLPGPLSAGVAVVASTIALLGRLIGYRRTVDLVADRPLLVVRDYVRLLRSLSYAFVWETWPDTQPDGAPSCTA